MAATAAEASVSFESQKKSSKTSVKTEGLATMKAQATFYARISSALHPLLSTNFANCGGR
jgi:hypothetical protein